MTLVLHARSIKLVGVHNLRDLGGHVHPLGAVAWRQFWRSDSLHELGAEGVENLIERGLRTVIDLRQDTEAAAQPNPFARHGNRVAYHNAPIFEGLDLSDPEIVDAPDPLLALYKQALSERGPQFVAVMRLIAGAPAGAVLFHCTVGKDRTGMVAAMLLKLANVSDADIIADYAETGSHIGPVLTALRARAEANNWDVERLSRYWRSDASTMEQFLMHLEADYGGVASYLTSAGLSSSDLAAISQRLTQPAPGQATPAQTIARSTAVGGERDYPTEK